MDYLIQRFHCGEQQNISDRLTVGQQHGHAVDAEADAARRGHAQFEGVEEVLVGGKMALKGHLGDDFCCAARVFTFLRSCFRSAGRSVSSSYARGTEGLGATFRGSEKP